MSQPKKIDAHIGSEDEDQGFDRDWMKIDRNVQSDGFRSGLETSQEQSLQTGFNAAFREALQMALAGGKLQGAICASLSSAPNDLLRSRLASQTNVKQDDSQELAVNTGGQLSTSPLQNLLTANTELISRIPSLLSNDLVRKISLRLGDNNQPSDCPSGDLDTCCQNKDSAIEGTFVPSKESQCTALSRLQGATIGGETQAEEQKGLISCEDVCNNKSDFWNQLESFRSQARSLGVVSTSD